MTTLERAARALCEARGLDPETPILTETGENPNPLRLITTTVPRWQRSLPEAAAVLQAIREPTEPMRAIVNPENNYPWWFEEAVAGREDVGDGVWQRMIDAALAEGIPA